MIHVISIVQSFRYLSSFLLAEFITLIESISRGKNHWKTQSFAHIKHSIPFFSPTIFSNWIMLGNIIFPFRLLWRNLEYAKATESFLPCVYVRLSSCKFKSSHNRVTRCGNIVNWNVTFVSFVLVRQPHLSFSIFKRGKIKQYSICYIFIHKSIYIISCITAGRWYAWYSNIKISLWFDRAWKQMLHKNYGKAK